MLKQRLLVLILAVVVGAVIALVKIPVRLGLDLQGGAQLTIQVQTTPDVPEITPRDLEGVLSVVRNRVDALGVSEPLVQTIGSDRILVQLPGVSDPQQAERVLGGTAQLEFRREVDKPEARAELSVRQQEFQQLLRELVVSEQSPDKEAVAQKQAEVEKNRRISLLCMTNCLNARS